MTIRGRRLADYKGVVIDMCNLTVSLTGGRIPNGELQTFRDILTAEGVRHRSYGKGDSPLSNTTVRISTPMDMHRLLCKLPGRLQTVLRD